MNIEVGDIFLTKSSSLLGKLIRKFSTSKGESKTLVNHVGIFATSSYIESAWIVEALTKVLYRPFVEGYFGKNIEVAIYRMKGLQTEDRFRLLSAAEDYVGRTYGYIKILAHLLDYAFHGIYFFRRLAGMDRYPICSWLVAHVYAELGVSFGVKVGKAQPDDIWDYIHLHPEMFEQISGLQKW